MDLMTGEVRRLEKGELPGPNDFPVDNLPDKNCRKCYGRGYIGRDAHTKKVIPCRCVFK